MEVFGVHVWLRVTFEPKNNELSTIYYDFTLVCDLAHIHCLQKYKKFHFISIVSRKIRRVSIYVAQCQGPRGVDLISPAPRAQNRKTRPINFSEYGNFG